MSKLTGITTSGPARWPELMSREIASEYLNVSARTFSRLKAAGEFKSVLVLGLVKYRRSELDAYIDRLPYGDGDCRVNHAREAAEAKQRGKAKAGAA